MKFFEVASLIAWTCSMLAVLLALCIELGILGEGLADAAWAVCAFGACAAVVAGVVGASGERAERESQANAGH